MLFEVSDFESVEILESVVFVSSVLDSFFPDPELPDDFESVFAAEADDAFFFRWFIFIVCQIETASFEYQSAACTN